MSFFDADPPRRPDRPGARLCRLDEIPDGQAKGFELTADDGARRAVFVLRRGAEPRGFLNLCPHAGLPLDLKPDAFVARDGRALLCANHGARFALDDGRCLAGPCGGAGLTPVPVALDGESWVVLA